MDNKKIVLVGGCFDVIHFGHVSFLKQAKALGEWLTVALESDENVKRLKGSARPIHNQEQRKAMLESLRVVDEVLTLGLMTSDVQYDQFIGSVKPGVIAVTEGDPIQAKKQKQADKFGAKLVVIPKIITPSTSQLAKLLEID